MKSALVTGGAGFIGSHLCDYLLEKGYRVIAADNLSTGNSKNIAHLKGNDNFTYIQIDVSKNINIDSDLDYIFHFASPASPIDYQELPIETMMVNSLGTLNCLELAEKKGARFLLASTSEAYGDPLEHPQKESYWGNVNPVGIRSCYDESKRYAEALTMSFFRKRGVDARIIRIFNTYGPRMRGNDGRVVPNFITQALKGDPLTVYGDGTQTRSFCYVSDLVVGISKVMFSEGIAGELFNLGNPGEFTILELAEMTKRLTNSDSEITYRELPKDDPMRRKPDITKIKETLGWEPTVPLEEGLGRTIDWFREGMHQRE